MKTKIFKLFGLKIFEIVTYQNGEEPMPKPFLGKPEGEVLVYTPSDMEKDEKQRIEKEMKEGQ